MRAHYETIKAKRLKGEIYYTLPFETLAEVQIKQGDLVFVGAYSRRANRCCCAPSPTTSSPCTASTSPSCSLEMSRDATRTMFTLFHANNKQLYPNTPDVPVSSYKEGTLDDAEEDFMVTISNWDLTTNPNYGSLLIEQPNKADFSLADLTGRLRMIEQTMMPVQVLVIDYITHMNPVPIDRLAPVRNDDYNLMIHDLKRLCLTYRDSRG